MATYDFTTVQGTSIAFDPALDTLSFDAGAGSAGALRFETLGFNLQVFLGDAWVILEGTSYDALASSDLVFADGSQFLVGTAANETLTGGAGDDWLDGRAGTDAMAGGDGDDTYVLSQGSDTITEMAGEGIDTVQSWLTGYALGANLENVWLRFNGPANAYGNALDNTFYAGIGDNLMSGGAGRDTVSYLYAEAGVSVWLALAGAQATGGSGNDTFVGIENLVGSRYDDVLRGNSLGNFLNGQTGNDTLNGGLGIDTLVGGDGNDTYIIDDAADLIQETDPAGGIDLVQSSLTATVLGANLENLRLTAAGDANGYGNALDNLVYAGTGNNSMNGGLGNDTLSYAYALGAVTMSLALTTAQSTGGSGSDIAVNFENLVGGAFGDTLSGNAAANLLVGAGGNDYLRGNGGADTMMGGTGSDTFHVDNAGDIVIEYANEGTDRVETIVSYTLGANVEQGRILLDHQVTLTGNSLDNVLFAGTAQCTLDGAGGIDTVSYAYLPDPGNVSHHSAFVDLGAGQALIGRSTNIAQVLVGIENVIGSDYYDSLTGDANANRLEGGLGNDTLDGAAGNDTMIGGVGADSYYVRDAGDIVYETDASGGDAVYVYLAGYALTQNVEWMHIMTAGGANVFGNSLDNTFWSGVGADTINGFGGHDTVRYDEAGAALHLDMSLQTAETGGVTDQLHFIQGVVGTAFGDTMLGDDLDDSLYGGAGDDWIDGGLGVDTLNGEGGDDTVTGGLGADVLIGDTSQRDYFRYTAVDESTATSMDTIWNFHATDGDHVDLSLIDANPLLAGDQAFVFIGTAAFSATDATAQLRFDTATHQLQGSIDADTDAEFVVLLAGVASVGNGDVIV